MQNGSNNFIVHTKVWKDWKLIAKHHKGKEFQYFLPTNTDDLSDEIKIDSVQHLKAIKNSILNALGSQIIESIAKPYDRQPFLQVGWKIYKMRWAIDNKGQSSGLRIIFCINASNILLAYVARKSDCAIETKLEKEFMTRIREYIN
jgi:hypothetical protein